MAAGPRAPGRPRRTSHRRAVDTLLHLVLRGPVEDSTITEIWKEPRQRPVRAGAGARRARQRSPRRPARRLAALPAADRHPSVDTRWWLPARARCSRPTAGALDTLAVWEPAGLTLLEAQSGRPTLETLDRARVPHAADRPAPPARQPRPPAVRRDPPRPDARAERRRLLLARADAIDAQGARRREDPISVADTRLEGSGSADPRLLVRRHGWPATGRTSLRSSGSAGPRWSTA